MNQQLFDDLTADAPASTVDVPAIIRREKRRRGYVRVGAPAAAVLAVASAIAVFSPGAGGPAPGPTTVAEPPATVPSVAPGFRLVANDRATMAATAKTLRAALDDAVRKAAPGATWLTQGLTKEATPDGQPPRIFGDDLKNPTDQMFTGTTGLAVDGRRGTLSLNIVTIDPCTGGSLAKCPVDAKNPEAIKADMLKGLFECQPAAQKCTASTGPDGRRQRVQTSTSLGGYVSRETNVELADGRALMIAVSNQFIKPGSAVTNDYVAQSATPLTPAQVTTIAATIGDQIRA